MEIKLKQYIFLPASLNMSVGKAGSQSCHASHLALKKQRSEDGLSPNVDGVRIQSEWEKNGMCVIVLEAKDPEHLNNIAKYMEQWDIPNHLYIDEGITEVAPMTPTALATGVITEDKFWMFEQFKLFGEKLDAQSIVDGFNPVNAKNYEFVVKEPISFGPYRYKFEWCQKPKDL